MRLKDKVAVVTGGATGIGRATSVEFAREGAAVVIADVNDAEGAGVADEITAAAGTARFIATNVSCDADVAALMTAVESEFGRLDVVVNSAGIFRGPLVRIDEFEDDDWEAVIGVNLRGSYLCAKHAVALMGRSGAGVILLIAPSPASGSRAPPSPTGPARAVSTA